MAVAVLLSFATLMACSWRLFSYARDVRLEAAVLSTVLSITVCGISGTLCLVAGSFTPLHCAGLNALAALGLLGIRSLLRPVPIPQSRAMASPLTLVACAALIILGIGLRSPPMDAALAGRDQGTYMLRAAAAARHGAIVRTNPALATASASIEDRPGPADIVGLYPVDHVPHREGVYEGAYRPGFYLADRSQGSVVPQFLHLFPALLGMLRWLIPADLTPTLNVGLSALWLLVCFCVGLRIFGRELAALTWTAILCLDPLAIWVGRNPLTEPLDALLWMTALLCLLRKSSDGARAPISAAFFLGAAAWARGNMWLVAPLMLVSLLVPSPRASASNTSQDDTVSEPTSEPFNGGDGRLGALATWWFLLSSSLAIHAITSFPYLHDELRRLSLPAEITPNRIIWGVCIASLVIAVAAKIGQSPVPLARSFSPVVATVRARLLGTSTFLLVVVVATRKFWLVGSTTAGLARIDLLWPAITAPVLALALIGGLHLAIGSDAPSPKMRALHSDPVFGAMLLAIVGQAALYALPTLPQSGLFYYGRYLLPQLLPLVYGLAVAGVFTLGLRMKSGHMRGACAWVTSVTLVGWVASSLVLTPAQRIEEYAASRQLIEELAEQIPPRAVVIAGGEGWLHAHTYNQVAGALEIEHDITVLPYRTREAAFATAMELLVHRPLAEASPPPPVFLLLNESGKDRPGGPGVRRALIDVDFPAPLRIEPVAAFELFGHRLERSGDRRPERVLRNEIRLVLASVAKDATSNSRTFSIAAATTPLGEQRGDVLACIRDGDYGWSVRLPRAERGGPVWMSLVVPPRQRANARNWRVSIDSMPHDPAILKEKRAERSTLGPWLLRAPPSLVTIQGATAATCADALSSLTLTHVGDRTTRAPSGNLTHRRIAPALSERGGYGDTTWTYGHMFNRFRLGARAPHVLEGDSIWLRRDHPIHFPPMLLGPGSYEVSATLKGLESLDLANTEDWRIVFEFDGADPLELALGDRPQGSVWTPVVGIIRADAPVLGLSVTLHAPDERARVELRDVALIPVVPGVEAAPTKLR